MINNIINEKTFLFLFVLLFNCCTTNKKELIVKKIYVEAESCIDCIGIKSFKIRYLLKSDFLFADNVLVLKKNNNQRLTFINLSNLRNDKLRYKHEFVYDDFNMVKYRCLSQIKKDFYHFIYFKKNMSESNIIIKCDSSTTIEYKYNGKIINENNQSLMNLPISEKFVRPDSTKPVTSQ
jgi:hypothetical protein